MLIQKPVRDCDSLNILLTGNKYKYDPIKKHCVKQQKPTVLTNSAVIIFYYLIRKNLWIF